MLVRLGSIMLAAALCLAAPAWTQPTGGPSGVAEAVDLATTPLAPVFVSDDGGLVYLRERDGRVYWFAEHPGRGYSHVFRGRRDGTRIRGRFVSVPKYSADAVGRVTMRVSTGGHLVLDGDANRLPFARLRPRAMREVRDRLPPQTMGGFRARGDDVDGAYEDQRGRRLYVRTVGDDVVFYAESDFRPGQRPQASYVYFGERIAASPSASSGPLISMPKGRARASGDFNMIFADNRGFFGASTFGNLREVTALPLGIEVPVRLMGEAAVDTRPAERRGDTLTVEGDIAVGELPANAHATPNLSYALSIFDGGRLWPGCEVPYEPADLRLNSLVVRPGDGDVDLPTDDDPDRTLADIKRDTRDALRGAVDYVNRQTPFTWRPRRAGDSNYVDFRGFEAPCSYADDDRMQPIACGRSRLGMVGGRQEIGFTIPSRQSPTVIGQGTFVHEMGHAMGLRHEHTRIDRDDFVRIDWNAVRPSARGNFERRTTNAIEIGPYDINSNMHYGQFTFSRNGQPTVIPLQQGARIGRLNDQFTEDDLIALRAMCPDVDQVDAEGRRGHGAGIAVTQLDDDPSPELVLMAYDDREGQNVFKIRRCEFSSFYGRLDCAPSLQLDGLGHRGEGAGIAFGNLDGFGADDMMVAVYDTDNTIRYRICRDFADEGLGRCLSARAIPLDADLGRHVDGLGVAIGPVDPGGRDEVVVAVYDDPDGQNRIRYVVGRNPTNLGHFTWAGPFDEDGLSHRADGFGATLFDDDGNGRMELMFGILDDRDGPDGFMTVTLRDVTTQGISSGQRLDQRFLAHSSSSDGAGIAAWDFNADGGQDLVLMSLDDPGNDDDRNNLYKVRVVFSSAR